MIAPVLFVVVFASIEFSRVSMLRNTCQIAAAEGARRGILPGATADQCRDAALGELEVIGVDGATATVTPTVILDATADITVRVDVPVAQNGYVFPRFFLGRTLTSSVTLQRETPVSR